MESDERQYTLHELATTAGVSVRTIRYYIGEGLLPAPAGAGPQSHYTQSHLNRLRAIGLLKDRYLPLKEIRKALSGLDDAEIERMIVSDEGDALPEAAEAPLASAAFMLEEPEPLYDALSYIDTALTRGPSRSSAKRGVLREDRPARPVDAARWRKIEVADGVELLVREDLYDRRREHIDWLIDWARKVVG